jgi:hypothetical protein
LRPGDRQDTGARAIVEICDAPVTKNEIGWIMEIRAAIRSVFGK